MISILLFYQKLITFCCYSKLAVSRKVLLPVDRYTYISDAQHTASGPHHFICMADTLECLKKGDILHDMATTDHILISMRWNLQILPELISYDSCLQNRKSDCLRFTEYNYWQNKFLTEEPK